MTAMLVAAAVGFVLGFLVGIAHVECLRRSR